LSWLLSWFYLSALWYYSLILNAIFFTARKNLVIQKNNPSISDNYLKLSPFTEILPGSTGSGGLTGPSSGVGSFGSLEFSEETRLARAYNLFDQSFSVYLDSQGQISRKCNSIKNLLLAVQADSIGHDASDASHLKLLAAIDLISGSNGIKNDIKKAYANYYEDSSGSDADGNGFIGGVGLMQNVYDNPTRGGPFDSDLGCDSLEAGAQKEFCRNTQTQNVKNRKQLAEDIAALKTANRDPVSLIFYEKSSWPWIDPDPANPDTSHTPPPGMDLNGRMDLIKGDLDTALSHWNQRHCYHCGFFGRCCDEERYQWFDMRNALEKLNQIIEAFGYVPAAPALNSNLTSAIGELHRMMRGGVNSVAACQDAITQANLILSMCRPSQSDTVSYETDYLESVARKLLSDLTKANDQWDEEGARQGYLDDAYLQEEILYEGV